MHFSYEIPKGLVPDAATAQAALKAEAEKADATKAIANCISIPLMAMESEKTFRMASFVQMDMECLGATAAPDQIGAMTTSMLNGSLKQFGEGTFSTPSDYKLGDFNASFVRGSAVSVKLGVTFYASAACIIFSKQY